MTGPHDAGSAAVFTELAEILRTMRASLVAYFGDEGGDWETAAFPDATLQRLEARRQQRAALSWSLDAQLPLIEFASFAEIADLVGASPGAAAPFLAMVPQPQVLQVRLLELAVVMDKLALAHPTGEQDLVVVRSFGQRLAQITGQPPASHPATTSPAVPVEFAAPEPFPAPRPATAAPALEFAADLDAVAAPSAPVPPVAAPSAPVPPVTRPPVADAPRQAPQRSPSAPEPVVAPQAQPTAAVGDAARQAGPASLPKVSDDELVLALERRNTTVVLRALYREIMTSADSMWSRALIPAPRTWLVVRESAWYQEHFSSLGMKPVSDFYCIVEDGIEAFGSSATRDRIQGFLGERGFPQVLVGLRDFFQRHLK